MKIPFFIITATMSLGQLCMDRPDSNQHFIKDAERLLFHGARMGSLDLVRSALSQGANVNARNHINATPLHFAAHSGHLEIVRELLYRGASVDVQDNNLLTPLILAAYRGHQLIVEELLARGADLNTTDNQARTALYAAAYNGHHSVVHLLMEAGADEDMSDFDHVSPLHAAAFFGHDAVVQELLSRGVNCEGLTIHKKTPLTFALQRGYEHVVHLLVKFGAELPSKDSPLYDVLRTFFKNEPLNFAAVCSDTSAAEKLLQSKEHYDKDEALLYAISQRRINLVHLLLGHGANPEIALQHTELLLHRTFLSHDERVDYDLIQEQIFHRLSLRQQAIRQRSLVNPELIQFECLPLELREPLAHAALLASARSGNILGAANALHHISLTQMAQQIMGPRAQRKNFSLYALLTVYCINLMS